jgi:hypothetical protein
MASVGPRWIARTWQSRPALLCGCCFTSHCAKQKGFVASIFEMMNLALSVPDHTTLSREVHLAGCFAE